MDGFAADDAGEMITANPDRLSRKLPFIHTTDDLKSEDPFAFVFHQKEADFIHMRIEHHPHRVVNVGVAGDEHIAHRIHANLIRVGLDCVNHDFTDFIFIAGDCNRVAQFFQ